MSRFAQWRLRHRLHRLGIAHRADFVLPDGVDGYVHIEQALLRPEGLYVLDVLEGRGQLIAGERLAEWTLVGKRRFVFPNPLATLARKVTAARMVAGQAVPFTGFVVLADGLEVPRGRPPGLLSLAELQRALPALRADAAVPPDYAEAWARLAAVPTHSGN